MFILFLLLKGEFISYVVNSRVGGVVVSVLATGPKGCGFEPGQDDGFFNGR
jgi:hypothetical protein